MIYKVTHNGVPLESRLIARLGDGYVWRPQPPCVHAPRVSAALGTLTVAQSFVSPIPRRIVQDECAWCENTRFVECRECDGVGRVGGTDGGYHKKNHVPMTKIIGSKWTSLERTLGWRHFRVREMQKIGKLTFLLMAATCDESAMLWIPVDVLRSRNAWASGWLQKQQLKELISRRQEGILCPTCGGGKVVQCMYCSGSGEAWCLY